MCLMFYGKRKLSRPAYLFVFLSLDPTILKCERCVAWEDFFGGPKNGREEERQGAAPDEPSKRNKRVQHTKETFVAIQPIAITMHLG